MSRGGGLAYDYLAVIDTSAAVALLDQSDSLHSVAAQFFADEADSFQWCVLNATSHETFTRLRYDHGLNLGLKGYDLLRSGELRVLSFDADDELEARSVLTKYSDHDLSFHDALCATVMIREGIFKVFTFDAHFWSFGFEVMPGRCR